MTEFMEEFEHAGLRCVILRMPLGHLCGYVALPAGHPLFGKDYGSTDQDGEWMDSPVSALEIHGGITYAEASLDGVESNHVWWLGFDCAHYMDFDDVPGQLRGNPNKGPRFVRLELKDLAEQLAKMQ